MEKEYLSKVKEIWLVYPSSDGITQERRPVAYINQSFIYIIEPTGEHLRELSLDSIRDFDAKAKWNLEYNIAEYLPFSMHQDGMKRCGWGRHLYLWERMSNADIEEWRDYAKKSYQYYVDQFKQERLMEDLEAAKQKYEMLYAECKQRGLING